MDFTAPAPLSITTLTLNLVLGLLISLIISLYYVKYGKSLSNRAKFASILPILTLITLLVISIVKSSLALSLGLVGALSIVRFRTAIKDPEELIFLFFAIAIGLGMGADQRIPTLVAFILIMAYLAIRSLIEKDKKNNQSLYLNIQLPKTDGGSDVFTKINETLPKILSDVDLRRMDNHNDLLQLTYYFSISDSSKLAVLMDTLKQSYPTASISVIEQNNLLGG